MSNQKKKIFPKIKKKLKSFLTDESWKITKKDALGLAVGAVILSWVDEVAARTDHSNVCYAWHWSTSWHWNGYHSNWQYCSTVTVQHSSWIVNWHYSWTAWYSWWNLWWHWSAGHSNGVSHSQWAPSHSNHSSHWSWGWC